MEEPKQQVVLTSDEASPSVAANGEALKCKSARGHQVDEWIKRVILKQRSRAINEVAGTRKESGVENIESSSQESLREGLKLKGGGSARIISILGPKEATEPSTRKPVLVVGIHHSAQEQCTEQQVVEEESGCEGLTGLLSNVQCAEDAKSNAQEKELDQRATEELDGRQAEDSSRTSQARGGGK